MVIGVQVRYEDGTELLQDVDDICAAEMTIQLTQGVLTTVKQHAVIVTTSRFTSKLLSRQEYHTYTHTPKHCLNDHFPVESWLANCLFCLARHPT